MQAHTYIHLFKSGNVAHTHTKKDREDRQTEQADKQRTFSQI